MKILSKNDRTKIILTSSEISSNNTILKVLEIDTPSTAQTDQFHHEWEITKGLDILGVRKALGITFYEGKPAIILEYIDGHTIRHILDKKGFDLKSFLNVSIKLTSILGEIHQEKIIHKDLNPENILVEKDTQEIKIIDFGLATSLKIKNTYLGNPELIKGNLKYISPEQTGRMNRTVDYRSDLYSLGITLYEMLCSQLPFQSNDPMELVHNHLAIVPDSPLSYMSIDSDQSIIFEALESIIFKLLHKSADDRYQSSFGLKEDLELCLKSLDDKGLLKDFQPGQSDFSERFQIPQKLYGREKEIEYLINVYRKVSKGSTELVLVSGYSGVGKSALVYEIHKPVTENLGYFIEGKFDQYQRNIPYYAWIQAFDNFVQLLLTENQIKLERWKSLFNEVLAGQGKVLTELIPSLEKIIGRQPDLPELTPKENQSRFNNVFLQFVKTIAISEHPLFIFIDDWQWSDIPSLELLEKILTESTTNSLLIAGAFRDNEISIDHPFDKTLKRLKSQIQSIHEIRVENLSQYDINLLVSDTLKCPMEYCKPMSRLIFKKTNGNAFFLRQMLYSLYENQSIQVTYDSRIGMRWDWDIQKIVNLNITENVVELMVEKTKKLPQNTRKILSLASCIGTLFQLSVLSVIYQKSEKETYKGLFRALEEGLVISSGGKYKFAHDRIQQAVYSLISKKEKEKFHLSIGRTLLKYEKARQEIILENIFDVVNQLNYGRKFIVDTTEKLELAKLNLQAGIQAKRSIAYESAQHYLQIGKSLLTKENWHTDYDLSYSIYRHLAEAEGITMNFEKSRILLDETLINAKNLDDKVEIAEFILWVNMLDYVGPDGLKTSLQVLAACNIDFPRDVEKLNLKLKEQYAIIWKLIDEKGVQSFLQLQEMTEKSSILGLKILSKLFFVLGHQLGRNHDYEYAVTSSIILGLKYGRNENMLPALSHFGSLLAAAERYKDTYELAMVAEKIADNYSIFHAKVQYMNRSGLWCRIYGQRLDKIIPYFEKGVQVGFESGNIIGGSICQYDILLHKSYQGNPISEVAGSFKKLLSYIKTMGFNHLLIYCHLEYFKLLGFHKGDTKYRIRDSFPEENNLELTAPIVNNAWLGHVSMADQFWWEDYAGLIVTYEKFQSYIIGCTSNIIWADHFFYLAIAIIKQLDKIEENRKEYYQQLLVDCARKIKKMALSCPENFQHKDDIITAEKLSLNKNDWAAAEFYNKAIESAKLNHFKHHEGLAHKLCGAFWKNKNQYNYAKFHFEQAVECYKTWEAFALIQNIKDTYSDFFSPTIKNEQSYNSYGTNFEMDLESLLKASQVLSGEIILSNLIDKMLPIVIENSGAQSGLLIAISDFSYQVIAEGKSNGEVHIYKQNEVENTPGFPIDLVNYVVRTNEVLCLENATSEEMFSHDIYIQALKPRSVICLPIHTKEKLSYVFYLENNVVEGVFSERQVRILQSLSSQIGISIENALLYDNQAKVREAYSKFVPHSFLEVLGYESILEVKLGDQVQKRISVLFSDIRSYTSLSEKMSPAENFDFLNAYLRRVAPAIKNNHGFVSQYQGDGIMALFLEKPEDAIQAAVDMQINLRAYNQERNTKGRMPIKIGIGIHTGLLMLGILGEEHHQQATVVSDAVNIASRMEGLTKYYYASIIISQEVLNSLQTANHNHSRFLGKVQVVGKSDIISIYEIYDGDLPEIIDMKKRANNDFQQGLNLYFNKDFIGAAGFFKNALTIYPDDLLIKKYFERTAKFMIDEVPEGWTGAELMTEK